MENINNTIAPRQQLTNLFELAKKVKSQQGDESPIEDKIKTKIEELKTTGSMEVAPPIVVGSTGIVLQGNKVSKDDYLKSLEVDEDMYGNIVLTEDEARRINSKMKKFTAGVNSVIPMACTGDRCAFKSTCLIGSTPIAMYDGSHKYLKDIKRRDRILSFNTQTNRIELDTAFNDAVSKGIKEVYKLTTSLGHEIYMTDDHPVYSAEKGTDDWMYACIKTGLQPGDRVLITDAYYSEDFESCIYEQEEFGDVFTCRIESIEYIGEEDVYDVQIVNNQNFFASGILVHNCPYYQERKAPVGLPCLVETNLVHYYTSLYIEEFDVDPTRVTEMHLVGELAELDIYEIRATKIIAEKHPTMLQDTVMGFDGDGNPIINEDISKVFDLKERLKKSRMKILETLMATRKERAKATIPVLNQETTSASLKTKLDMILRTIKDNGGSTGPLSSMSGDVIDAETIEG